MKGIDRRRLIGTWELMRWSVTEPDGSVADAMGSGARGLMVFTPDGWATISIAAGERPRLSRRLPGTATTELRAAAFDAFVNYCCRWRVVGTTVELDVRLAQNPAVEGTLQVRGLSLRGRTLTTSSREPTERGLRVHGLRWRPATERSMDVRTANKRSRQA